MNRSATSLETARSIRSCSTPHSSGNSDRMVRPPRATSRSEVCPMAGEAVRSATLQAHTKVGQLGRAPRGFVGFNQTVERALDCLREHRERGAALLLLQYHQWLIEFGVPPVNLFAQNINLRVLAAEAEQGRPGHIGMMNVARNQSTQVVRVFPSAST